MNILSDTELAGLHAELRQHWPAGPLQEVRVLAVRRSASRHRDPHPLRLLLELTWHDTALGNTQWQRLSGKSWRDGGSATAFAALHGLPWAPAEAGPQVPPLLHLPALDLLLWAWPNDPALPQLPRLMDPGVWPAGSGPVLAVRHTPEDRATLRRGSAWAKTFHDDRAATLHRRFHHFEQRAAVDSDAPQVPSTLGWSTSLRTLWQGHAEGRPLDAAAPQPGDAVALGRALASVHTAPGSLAAPRAAGHLALEIERRRHKIARVQPALAPRAQRLADALQRQIVALPPRHSGVIHGDCHFEQFARAPNGGVLMFDLDEMGQGDPMEDLASLFARDGVSGHWVAPLLNAYRETAPMLWCAERLRWHRALQALLQASRAFVFQVPDWPAVMDRRLRVAEDLL